MKLLQVLLTVGFISIPPQAKGSKLSGPWSGFYDQATLTQTADNMRSGILENWQHVIQPTLTTEERARLKRLRFVFDLESRDHPLNFFAIDGEIHLPASSVRMLGDLLASWMWLDRHGYSTVTVNEYLAILKYQWPSGALRTQPYLPMKALGVPAGAREDSAIATDYSRLFSSAIFFIVCHELGHVVHGHEGVSVNDSTASAHSVAQEKQADGFALEILRRIGEVPFAIPLYFSFTAALELAPADPGYGRLPTHPLSSERILFIASGLRNHAKGFARGFQDPLTSVPKVNAIADQLDTVAQALESPTIQDFWRQKGLGGRLQDVKPRRLIAMSNPTGNLPKGEKIAFNGTYVGKWVNLKSTDFDVRMDLVRDGEAVSGNWTFGPNRVAVKGTVSGGRLYFDWTWGADYFGKGELYMKSDDSIAGSWGYTKKADGGGTWKLARP